MKLALIDFDGTLVDSSESLAAASMEIVGKPLTQEGVTSQPFPIKNKIYDLNIRKYRHLYSLNEKVVEFIKKLVSEGFELKILTARPCEVKSIIEEFISKAGLDIEVICRSDLKTEDEDYKLAFLKSVSAEKLVLLEDKEDNIVHIKKHFPDLEAYLVIKGELHKR
ncbi:MAG: hypothetical protein GOV01_01145 [Candidatus Altiarchaeota archaeon]|nr:hypothetical protein [Candidatus Altiarchaeota archaeon]